MDKEAIEKIAEIINEAVAEGIYYPREPYADRAVEKIAQVLKGYRKPPKGEPPLLSDEEIVGALNDLIASPAIIKKPERAIAQAQREADIKYYEEGNDG